MTPVIIGSGVGVFLLILAGIFIASRIVTVDASEALIISGSIKDGKPRVVLPGGRTFIVPIIHSAQSVDLSQSVLTSETKAPDSNKVEVNVTASISYKVDNDEASIRAAAERFSGTREFTESMRQNVDEVMQGSLRSIISTMTTQEIISDRATLMSKVQESASSQLAQMGLTIESFQVSKIVDSAGYVEALGRPEIERVKSEARQKTAEAEARAKEVEIARLTEIKERERDSALKIASFKADADRAQAEANAAGPMMKAEKDMEIAKIEAETERARAELKERELDTNVRKPADAALYERQKSADAEQYEQERKAEAALFAQKKNAEAKQYAIEKEAEAESFKIESVAKAKLVESENEAKGILARGEAEAEALSKNADAYAKYGEAAKIQMVIEKMPEIVEAAARPQGNIQSLNVLSTDGAGAMTRTVAETIAQAGQILQSQLGVNLSDLVGGLASKE